MKGKPNILFLQTDQHRFDALGCVNSIIKTPHLDIIAKNGIRFEQAVCNNPMCVPSRYSMMTGVYSSQIGVRHNTQMCEKDNDLHIETLAERLKKIGYKTAGFGKTHWYCGIPDEHDQKKVPNPIPSLRGFEVRAESVKVDPSMNEPGALIMENEDPEAIKTIDKENEGIRTGGENALGYLGLDSDLEPKRHPDGWLTQKTLEHLSKREKGDDPFFVYLSLTKPHAALNVPKKYVDMYDINDIDLPQNKKSEAEIDDHYIQPRNVAEWKTWREEYSPEQQKMSILRYYASCTYIDDLIGDVIQKLKDLDELENTFIVFTSDHGDMLGERYKFSKYNLYEGSVRVPLIISGYGISDTNKGKIDNRPCSLVDLLPTFMSIANQHIDPQFSGHNLLDQPKALGSFSELHGSGYHETEKAPAIMWRTEKWKLVLYLPGEFRDLDRRLDEFKGELYSLENDTDEIQNLYEDQSHLAIREKLTRQLLIHLTIAWSRYPRPYSYTDIY
jgi:arylsulfatase A-like enzyme